jgi:hypothetical protein
MLHWGGKKQNQYLINLKLQFGSFVKMSSKMFLVNLKICAQFFQ